MQIGGGHNTHEAVLKVAEMVIKESRATRVQPFNEYRKKFNLKPYSSFEEFTGKHIFHIHKGHSLHFVYMSCILMNYRFHPINFGFGQKNLYPLKANKNLMLGSVVNFDYSP